MPREVNDPQSNLPQPQRGKEKSSRKAAEAQRGEGAKRRRNKEAIPSKNFGRIFPSLLPGERRESKKIISLAFEAFNYLIEHRERVVEKQELFEQIWKESFVSDTP
jgi:two-component SAPR family response regulator